MAVFFIVLGMDILEKLFSNQGLVHVAEHVVSFLDDTSVSQCRLVSKFFNEYLENIWLKRSQKEAQRQCEIKYIVLEKNYLFQTSFSESWPEWKSAVKEIDNIQDLNDAIYFMKQYRARMKSVPDKTVSGGKSLSLHYIADNMTYFLRKKTKQKGFLRFCWKHL